METTNVETPTLPIGLSAAVTTRQTFTTLDDHALFSINAGVPVCLALEQASSLLECTRKLVTNRDSIDTTTEATITQFLIDMAKATVDACSEGLEAVQV